MTDIERKILELRKAYPLFDVKQFQLLTRDRQGIPPFVLRVLSELEFANQMAVSGIKEAEAPVSAAADILLNGMKRDGQIVKACADHAEKALMPLAEKAKSYIVHMVSHAHIDMNWMWPYHETVAVTLETFRTMLKLMREYPEFTFSQSQASVYEIVEKYDKKMLAEIKDRIKEGRWEVSASTWVEADKNMSNLTAMASHLLYTKEYLSELLDLDPATLNLDFEPDTFGHSANVPEILNQGGVKYYYHCRGFNQEAIYQWEAPSGARVIAFRDPTWYISDTYPCVLAQVPALCARYGLNEYLRVYGVGDHGGGPSRRDITYILEMQKWPVYPTIQFSTYKNFFSYLEANRGKLPVVRQELNPIFTGCYTSQARIKMANRVGEAVMTEAQALDACGKVLLSRPSGDSRLKEGWRNVMFSQFHDILPGSGVRDTREYAMSKFSETMAIAGTEIRDLMLAFAENIDTSAFMSKADPLGVSEGAGVGYGCMDYQMSPGEQGGALRRLFHVFNPWAEERESVLKLTVWDWPGELSSLRALGSDGNELPLQLLTEKPKDYFIHSYIELLIKVSVPAMGYTTVILDEDGEYSLALPSFEDLRVEKPEEYVLENAFVRAEFDPVNGCLVSFINKKTKEELLNKPATFRYILEQPTGMEAWFIGKYIKNIPVTDKVYLSGVERGALESSFTLTTEFGEGSTLKIRISLADTDRHLTFDVECDLKDTGSRDRIPQLAFNLPFAYESNGTLYDIPGGTIVRPQQKNDLPALSFAAPLKRNGNSALVLSTDCKYGFRTDRNELQVTLLRDSTNPDPYPDRGPHHFRIYIHALEKADARTLMKEARFAARPLHVTTAVPSKGTLPLMDSFLKLTGNDVILDSMKVAEDGMGLILRLYNTASESAQATIRFEKAPQLALRTDLLEHPTNDNVVLNGKNVSMDIDAFGTASVRLVF